MSFLEMLDVVNEGLVESGQAPIAFDHDCREGICGSCGMMINGVAHGPMKGTATCQLHMRSFADGAGDLHRAVAVARVPGDQGSRREPGRVRSHHRGGWIHFGADGQRAGREHHSRSEAVGRRRHGRRCVHRVRRVRRGVSERLGVALHGGQDLAPRQSAAGTAGANASRVADGRADGRRRVRSLHALRRMSGCVSEGHQHRHDRADEPRFHRRDGRLRAKKKFWAEPDRLGGHVLRRFFDVNRRASAWVELRLPHARNDIFPLFEVVVAKYMNARSDQLVADVGGGQSCPFAKDRRPELRTRIVAVDVSEEEIQHNRDVDETRVANIMERLPFEPDELDMIVSRSVLEHLTDLESFVGNSHTALKRGGYFIHLVPARYAPFAVINRALPAWFSKRVLYFFHPKVKGICGFPAFYDRCTYSGSPACSKRRASRLKTAR